MLEKQASDPLEVYFETIENDKEYLRKLWQHLHETYEAECKRLRIDYLDRKSVV